MSYTRYPPHSARSVSRQRAFLRAKITMETRAASSHFEFRCCNPGGPVYKKIALCMLFTATKHINGVAFLHISKEYVLPFRNERTLSKHVKLSGFCDNFEYTF